MTFIPAYGRDYKSRAAVLKALKANKDFIVVRLGERDRPANLAYWLTREEKSLSVRYSANRKLALFDREELV